MLCILRRRKEARTQVGRLLDGDATAFTKMSLDLLLRRGKAIRGVLYFGDFFREKPRKINRRLNTSDAGGNVREGTFLASTSFAARVRASVGLLRR